jgi:hypothetical protein
MPDTDPHTIAVTLAQPLEVNGKTLTSLTLRRPLAGDLRGVRLLDLLQMEPGAVAAVVNRISEPRLPESAFWGLDPEDLTNLATEVAGFLAGKAADCPPG